MKLEHGQSNVVGSAHTGASSDFRINASAHAFRILSSGLYSDKIGAVLREIGCNAADAHIEAGLKNKPFEVKLPNVIDPHFYIKDFGPGLSDEQVRELYTTYFASTKQASNDFTGAFGLGSKSPFSYTDSFTVTSSKAGIKRVYTAHLNDQGSPAITLMAEEPSEADWPSGVSVGFPVQPGDFGDFRAKAEAIYRFFSPIPVILGMETTVTAPEFEISTDLFQLKGKGETHLRAAVQMGNVAYPLSWSRLSLKSIETFKAVEENYRNKHRDSKDYMELVALFYVLCDMDLQLKLPIGEVQVTASREELEYDPKSREAVMLRLLEAAQGLGGMIRALVEDESLSLWERRLKARAFMRADGKGRGFEGKHIKALLRFCELPEDRIEFFIDPMQECPEWLGRTHVKAHQIGEATGRQLNAWSRPIWGGKFKTGNRVSMPIKDSVTLVVADTPFATQRVKQAVDKKQFTAALLLSAPKSNQALLAQTTEQLRDYFGGIPVVKVSELEPVDMQRAAYSGGARTGGRPAAAKAHVTIQYVVGDKAGTQKIVTLDEVPPTCRFYMVRDTGRQRMEYLLTAAGVSSYKQRIPNGQFKRTVAGLNDAVAAGLAGLDTLGVEGYVIVTEREHARHKLTDLGYVPFMHAVTAHLESNEVQAAFERVLADLPGQSLRSTAAGSLVDAVKNDTLVGSMVKAQLAGTQLGALIEAEAETGEQARNPGLEHLVALINAWHQAAGGQVAKCRQLLDEAQSRIDVKAVVACTLPGWCEVVSHSYYGFWQKLASENEECIPEMLPVLQALLTPAVGAPRRAGSLIELAHAA